MKNTVLILLIVIFTSSILPAQITENVFIIVIDGPRYSETFGDTTHQNIQYMWNKLKPLGTFYSNFYNDGVTKTNPGHASILTGTRQKAVNTGSERPDKPTLFEYYRKEKKTQIEKSYVVLGKNKLDILTYSIHPKYGYKFRASLKKSKNKEDDCATLENIKGVMKTARPHLLLSNFASVDIAGHDGSWSDYLTKIRIADSLVAELWNYIQSDSVYENKTTLIITNDHGRHLDGVASGYRNHGDDCEGCRHISLLVLGPDTPAGVVDSTLWRQIDITPTVGKLLGFETPYADGKIIQTAIKEK